MPTTLYKPGSQKAIVLNALIRRCFYERRWQEPWRIARAVKMRRSQCRSVISRLYRDGVLFRRPSGKSWYGTSGYEYRPTPAAVADHMGVGVEVFYDTEG